MSIIVRAIRVAAKSPLLFLNVPERVLHVPERCLLIFYQEGDPKKDYWYDASTNISKCN